MNLENMIKLWPQYQKWLKDNNITQDNAKEKAIKMLSDFKKTPEGSKAIEQVLNNPDLSNFAKSLKFPQQEINELKQVINSTPSSPTQGNLTSAQMEWIKKRRNSR